MEETLEDYQSIRTIGPDILSTIFASYLRSEPYHGDVIEDGDDIYVDNKIIDAIKEPLDHAQRTLKTISFGNYCSIIFQRSDRSFCVLFNAESHRHIEDYIMDAKRFYECDSLSIYLVFSHDVKNDNSHVFLSIIGGIAYDNNDRFDGFTLCGADSLEEWKLGKIFRKLFVYNGIDADEITI